VTTAEADSAIRRRLGRLGEDGRSRLREALNEIAIAPAAQPDTHPRSEK
jgi:hypothetical protein